MKTRPFLSSVLLSVLASLLSACGNGTSTPAEKPAATPSPDDVTISDKGITFNGKLIPVPGTEEQLTVILGPPDRRLVMSNNILTWDSKGFIALETPETTNIHTITVVVGPETFEFTPKTKFAGKIFIDAVSLDASSTVDNIKAAGLKQNPDLLFLFDRPMGSLILWATNSDTTPKLLRVTLETKK